MAATSTMISIAAEEAAGRGQQKVSVIRLILKILHVISTVPATVSVSIKVTCNKTYEI